MNRRADDVAGRVSNTPAEQAILLYTPDWSGMHPCAWRLPDAPINGASDLSVITEQVRTVERAKFQGMFLADVTGFRLEVRPPNLGKTSCGSRFEPFTLMAALAASTEHLGLLMTAGTTYEEPYHVARRFASLDHLSGGRIGWNIVTTGNQAVAQRLGADLHMEHDLRYERAHEFVEAVLDLFDSFDDDAFVRDKDSGVFFDVDRLHVTKQRGRFISVEGPLNVARPVQGCPVLAQAGSSPVGRSFAAKYAEVMFTIQPSLEAAIALRAEMRERAVDAGRRPDDIKLMPGLTVVVGRTQAEAEQRLHQLDDLLDVDLGLNILESKIDMDLSGCDLDGMLPDVPETERGTRTIQSYFVERARAEGLTIRQLMNETARWGAIAGSPDTIADRIEEWLQTGAADGFNVTFADEPTSLDLFCSDVVPERQRRGIFRDEVTGTTLRENLGLRRPPHRFTT